MIRSRRPSKRLQPQHQRDSVAVASSTDAASRRASQSPLPNDIPANDEGTTVQSSASDDALLVDCAVAVDVPASSLSLSQDVALGGSAGSGGGGAGGGIAKKIPVFSSPNRFLEIPPSLLRYHHETRPLLLPQITQQSGANERGSFSGASAAEFGGASSPSAVFSRTASGIVSSASTSTAQHLECIIWCNAFVIWGTPVLETCGMFAEVEVCKARKASVASLNQKGSNNKLTQEDIDLLSERVSQNLSKLLANGELPRLVRALRYFNIHFRQSNIRDFLVNSVTGAGPLPRPFVLKHEISHILDDVEAVSFLRYAGGFYVEVISSLPQLTAEFVAKKRKQMREGGGDFLTSSSSLSMSRSMFASSSRGGKSPQRQRQQRKSLAASEVSSALHHSKSAAQLAAMNSRNATAATLQLLRPVVETACCNMEFANSPHRNRQNDDYYEDVNSNDEEEEQAAAAQKQHFPRHLDRDLFSSGFSSINRQRRRRKPDILEDIINVPQYSGAGVVFSEARECEGAVSFALAHLLLCVESQIDAAAQLTEQSQVGDALVLHSTPLTYFPSYENFRAIGTLLTTIHLRHCGLVNIEAIGKLPTVRRLVLSNNRIRRCPPRVLVLPNVDFFDLSSNFIEELPDEWECEREWKRIRTDSDVIMWGKLQTLDVSRNYLKTVPRYCGDRMPSLVAIDFSYNAIETVPPSLLNNAAILRYLLLCGNPIRSSMVAFQAMAQQQSDNNDDNPAASTSASSTAPLIELPHHFNWSNSITRCFDVRLVREDTFACFLDETDLLSPATRVRNVTQAPIQNRSQSERDPTKIGTFGLRTVRSVATVVLVCVTFSMEAMRRRCVRACIEHQRLYNEAVFGAAARATAAAANVQSDEEEGAESKDKKMEGISDAARGSGGLDSRMSNSSFDLSPTNAAGNQRRKGAVVDVKMKFSCEDTAHDKNSNNDSANALQHIPHPLRARYLYAADAIDGILPLNGTSDRKPLRFIARVSLKKQQQQEEEDEEPVKSTTLGDAIKAGSPSERKPPQAQKSKQQQPSMKAAEERQQQQEEKVDDEEEVRIVGVTANPPASLRQIVGHPPCSTHDAEEEKDEEVEAKKPVEQLTDAELNAIVKLYATASSSSTAGGPPKGGSSGTKVGSL